MLSIELWLRPDMFRSGSGYTRYSRGRRLAWVAFLSLVLSSSANYFLAYWLGFSPSGRIEIYRRVGPENGPQVFCAGSSLLISGLSWPAISESFGQGIENWSVGGSTPDIWEEWQQYRPLSNTTIIGVSVYDLNEMHLADDRAKIVPLSRTINDLWASHADSALSHRLLTQYALKYVRLLFPTAGSADRVLVGLRSKGAELLGRQTSLAEHEGVLLQQDGVLDVGESTMKVSDWSSARLLRRIAVLRAENRGRHEFFNGPKRRAFERMLFRARRQGRVIVVVLPVSRAYTEEFIDESATAAFEREIQEAMVIAPEAALVRLDRVPGISDNGYFFDLVHMNSLGRRVTTVAFLKEVTQTGSQRRLEPSSTRSITADN
jgi:hypothetical protein